jgi:hypothetical protein
MNICLNSKVETSNEAVNITVIVRMFGSNPISNFDIIHDQVYKLLKIKGPE